MTSQGKLIAIFCEVFDDEDLKSHPAKAVNDVYGSDSFAHVNLHVAVNGKLSRCFSQIERLPYQADVDLLNCTEKYAEKL